MTKEAFRNVLLAVSDWKTTVDDVNGLSCQEFAKLLSKASGVERKIHFIGWKVASNSLKMVVYTSHQTVFLDSWNVFSGELICLVMVRDTNYQTNRKDHAYFIRF